MGIFILKSNKEQMVQGFPLNRSYTKAEADAKFSGGGGTWGSITGTLSNQTDLQTALNGKQATPTEYDNGNATGTATIDWNNGNVQYITLTGATTFTFSNPVAGGKYTLHVAGAFTPTFPATLRWPNNITPTASATAGRKDIWMFTYSGKESLYDGTVALNYLTT